MKLRDLIEGCGMVAVVLPDPDVEIKTAYTSDLLSDVMGHCPEDSVLITVQNHKNSVAVATLAGTHAIAVVHDRTIPDDMKALAELEGVALLSSEDNQFALSCKIGKLLES